MPQNLKMGDVVEFAHMDNIYRGIIIIKNEHKHAHLPNAYENRMETFLVQSVSVRAHGLWASANNVCVDFPALALTCVSSTNLGNPVCPT
jgi:uncharacterized protein (DUF2461 family)